jgi:hypothetical protein
LKSAKKSRGRPPKHKGERLSKNRTFRVRGLLDEYLIGRAQESGRSVSEEIEARLERSFYMDGIMVSYVGDAQPLLNAIALAVASCFLQYDRNDRPRIMQAATSYIIAAFGSSYCPRRDSVSSTISYPKVSEMRGLIAPDKYELAGLRVAYRVLTNLGIEMPEQIAELVQIFKTARESISDIGVKTSNDFSLGADLPTLETKETPQ